METILARKMWRTLEPYHSMVYFSPHAHERFQALGLAAHAGYFASRSAAMGPVPAEVVIATFYNFCPDLVRSAIPSAWEAASPAAILEARRAAVDVALREMLGDEVVGSDEMRTAAESSRIAAEACTPEGRPLYAAHAALGWPEEPHVALWHAITLLREFRGDGHIAALVAQGVSGCEALVTHAATEEGFLTPDMLKFTRAWPEEAWQAACDRLRARGWLDDGDHLTEQGAAARDEIERLTDERAMAPWQALGQDRCDQLRALVRPWSTTIVNSGGLSFRRG